MKIVSVRRDLPWLAATVLAAVAGSLIPLLTNNRFYYYDDTQAGAFGIWFEIGTKLRSGEWPVFSAEAWGAGNYAAEGQWGIWNPLVLLIGWLASYAPNAVVFATLLKIAFLCVLAAGTFLLARSYHATAAWSAIAGVAVTLTGFTVYMDAASWITGLMVFSLLPLTWFGLRRLAFGRGNPLLALVPAYVLITIGYVHGTLMLALLFAALVAEAWLTQGRKAIWRLVVAGLVAGLAALAVYLPGVLTAPVTARAGGILNSGFLTPDLTGLVTSWFPGSRPQITGWWGGNSPVPILYVAWFLPLLALVDFQKAKAAHRSISAVWIFGILSLALTLAPSDLGPLRFPVRLMPYFSLALLVASAVLISNYRLKELSRPRLIATAAIVASGTYLSWTQFPSFRLGAVFTVVALCTLAAALLLLYSRRVPGRLRGPVPVATALILLSLGVALTQRVVFPGSPLPDYRMPDEPAGYSTQLAGTRGGTFVVGDPTKLGTAVWNETLAGNAWYMNEAQVHNLYTPIMFAKYAEDLCIYPHGWTCNAAAIKLFQTDEATGQVLADLLSIDTVQILRDPSAAPEEFDNRIAPEGWHESARSANALVWERNEPLLNTGKVVWTSAGLDLRVASESSSEVVLHIERVGDTPAKAVFSRLAWPGYSVDGGSLGDPARGYLLELEVPQEAQGKDITVRFQPPGWSLAVGSMVIAITLGFGWGLAHMLRRRRRTVTAGSAPEPETLTGDAGEQPSVPAGSGADHRR